MKPGGKNNIRRDSGFFTGSGFQTAGDGTSGAVRGRLEFGNRQGNLKFVARFENGSSEYTNLKTQATGTAVITLTNDANNSLQLTWQKIAYSVVRHGSRGKRRTVLVGCIAQILQPLNDRVSVWASGNSSYIPSHLTPTRHSLGAPIFGTGTGAPGTGVAV